MTATVFGSEREVDQHPHRAVRSSVHSNASPREGMHAYNSDRKWDTPANASLGMP
ncbi:hypothetical protein ACFY3M_16070 [Streptomyces mirabilis]|uniref:hypothetical protein n=1 Tax=Streptomyces mirabilis TaxID=68239 RepID=UPI00368447B5